MEIDKIIAALILAAVLFVGVASCIPLDDEECPVNCTTQVTSPNGLVVECHCPN